MRVLHSYLEKCLPIQRIRTGSDCLVCNLLNDTHHVKDVLA